MSWRRQLAEIEAEVGNDPKEKATAFIRWFCREVDEALEEQRRFDESLAQTAAEVIGALEKARVRSL